MYLPTSGAFRETLGGILGIVPAMVEGKGVLWRFFLYLAPSRNSAWYPGVFALRVREGVEVLTVHVKESQEPPVETNRCPRKD